MNTRFLTLGECDETWKVLRCSCLYTEKWKTAICYVQSLEGFYGFPKGHIENNETEKETAIREIYEEVGLHPVFVNGFRIVDEYPISNSRGIIKQVVYFLAEYSDQKIRFQKEELFGAALMDFEEAMNVFQFASSKRILSEANRFLIDAQARSKWKEQHVLAFQKSSLSALQWYRVTAAHVLY